MPMTPRRELLIVALFAGACAHAPTVQERYDAYMRDAASSNDWLAKGVGAECEQAAARFAARADQANACSTETDCQVAFHPYWPRTAFRAVTRAWWRSEAARRLREATDARCGAGPLDVAISRSPPVACREHRCVLSSPR